MKSGSEGFSYLLLNKTCFSFFNSLMWFLIPKDLTYPNLFLFTAAGVVPCGGRKNVSAYSIIVQIIFSGLKESLSSY